MARYSSLHPVHRIKHVVDAQIAVPVNTAIENVIALVKDAPSLANTNEVETGAKINGFFITVEAITTESATAKTPNFYLAIWKNPGNNITMANGNAIGSSDSKNLVIHQEMVMLQGSASDDGVPRNIFKGVVVVPKGMRRCAPNDRWQIQYFIPSTGVATVTCLQVHYKEFR